MARAWQRHKRHDDTRLRLHPVEVCVQWGLASVELALAPYGAGGLQRLYYSGRRGSHWAGLWPQRPPTNKDHAGQGGWPSPQGFAQQQAPAATCGVGRGVAHWDLPWLECRQCTNRKPGPAPAPAPAPATVPATAPLTPHGGIARVIRRLRQLGAEPFRTWPVPAVRRSRQNTLQESPTVSVTLCRSGRPSPEVHVQNLQNPPS